MCHEDRQKERGREREGGVGGGDVETWRRSDRRGTDRRLSVADR